MVKERLTRRAAAFSRTRKRDLAARKPERRRSTDLAEIRR
jgi:hypothetical protein